MVSYNLVSDEEAAEASERKQRGREESEAFFIETSSESEKTQVYLVN